jgi:hypothetical protein
MSENNKSKIANAALGVGIVGFLIALAAIITILYNQYGPVPIDPKCPIQGNCKGEDGAPDMVTDKTIFTNDQEFITKKYADDKFIAAVGSVNSAKISPVAPAGQRDLFVPSANAIGDTIFGDTAIRDILYTIAVGVASYSIDGGTTWSPCVFDVPPVGHLYPGANPVVSVALTSTQAYRSIDGIHFVEQATPPAGIGANVLWSPRLGLFIARAAASLTQNVMTSPDGVTWTARTSPNMSTIVFAESNNRIVAAGTVSPFSMWSDDGITWTTTLSTLAAQCRGVSYSPEQAIWIMSTVLGVIYYSPDGKVWTPTGLNADVTVARNTLRWVGGTINRWYIASFSAGGNQSLWSSPDPRIASFVGCELDGGSDGGLPAGQNVLYGLSYDQLRGRFLIGYNAKPFISVGTPRPNDIKAISDNIRVRNSPVAVGLYSGYTDIAVNNTTIETSLTPSTGAIGSTFLQAPQPLGMTISTSFTVVVSSLAGATLTLRLKNGATILLSLPVVVPASSNDLPILVVFNTVIRATSAASSGTAQIAAVLPAVNTKTAEFTRTVGNTLSVTAQWSAGTSTLTMTQLTMDSTFRNGA